MSDEIRIVIADDHPVFLRGLRQIIAAEPNLTVVAEASDGEAALACIGEMKPDVAVLDLDMPGKDGFAVVRALQEQRLAVEAIFLTMHEDEALFNAALNLGVKGYVLKDSAIADIVSSIKTVAAGREFISPKLSSYLINRHRRATDLAKKHPSIQDLTPAERRVLDLIADNKTTREIAEQLCVSVRTIESHRANIAMKLDLHGHNAVLKFALANRSKLS